MRHPKLLIVGTISYNTKDSSRAYDAYFHYWEKENIAQIFSDPKTPVKGHCGTLYQITDYRLLQCWKGKNVETGTIYNYDELPESTESTKRKNESSSAKKAYMLGAKHSPLTHLLRGLLWRKRLWCTDKLNSWLDEFNPDCIFLSSSNDYFIPQIALYIANRYNIPIVSSISDDYYFNGHFSLNPLYHLYKASYKALVRKLLKHKGSAIYISDKIRDKYNSEFGLDGETVYLTSTNKRKNFTPVNVENPLITYFGNIRMGRNYSLNDIGTALGIINPNYKIEVYSGENIPAYYQVFDSNPNVVYGGTIPYSEVQNKMVNSDITVIVEGFQPKDIDCSRYSLSTKAADALASGAAILTYGSEECGIISYMQSTNASYVCTNKENLVSCISEIFATPEKQQMYYQQQIVMTKEHHNLEASCKTAESVVKKVINRQNK